MNVRPARRETTRPTSCAADVASRPISTWSWSGISLPVCPVTRMDCAVGPVDRVARRAAALSVDVVNTRTDLRYDHRDSRLPSLCSRDKSPLLKGRGGFMMQYGLSHFLFALAVGAVFGRCCGGEEDSTTVGRRWRIGGRDGASTMTEVPRDAGGGHRVTVASRRHRWRQRVLAAASRVNWRRHGYGGAGAPQASRHGWRQWQPVASVARVASGGAGTPDRWWPRAPRKPRCGVWTGRSCAGRRPATPNGTKPLLAIRTGPEGHAARLA